MNDIFNLIIKLLQIGLSIPIIFGMIFVFVIYRILLIERKNVFCIATIWQKILVTIRDFLLLWMAFMSVALISVFFPYKLTYNWMIEIIISIITCLYFLILILHLYVGVIALDFRISRKVFNILFITYYVLSFVEIFLLPMKSSDFKTKILTGFVVACISSGTLIYSNNARYNKGTWVRKKSFYYVNEKKFYIHRIMGNDVICSYNRLIDEKKGYKVEKLENVKMHTILQDDVEIPYDYLTYLLNKRKYEIIDKDEFVDCGIEKILERFNVKQIKNIKIDLFKHNWAFSVLLKGKYEKITEKMTVNNDNNKKWMLLKVKGEDDVDLLLLILCCKTYITSKRVWTYKLDKYVQFISSYFEYSLLEEQNEKMLSKEDDFI
ncbi:MAG: hypothetical protein NC240_09730 [Clostridium sp.]|nr:hypothetical protein [Clostridium sp.]